MPIEFAGDFNEYGLKKPCINAERMCQNGCIYEPRLRMPVGYFEGKGKCIIRHYDYANKRYAENPETFEVEGGTIYEICRLDKDEPYLCPEDKIEIRHPNGKPVFDRSVKECLVVLWQRIAEEDIPEAWGKSL